MVGFDTFLKRYLPKSLFGRALLILVLPIVLLQAVVASVFIQRHYDGVSAQMAGSIAREINYALDQVDVASDVEAASLALDRMAGPLGLEMGLYENETIEPAALRTFFDVTGGVIAETLKDEVIQPMAVDLVSFSKHVDAQRNAKFHAKFSNAVRLLFDPDVAAAIWPHFKFHIHSIKCETSDEVDLHLCQEAWTVDLDGNPAHGITPIPDDDNIEVLSMTLTILMMMMIRNL